MPVEISNLEKLKVLRLSYNALIGTFPSELGLLEHLEIVHLHSNRIQGNLTIRKYESPYESFYRIMHDNTIGVVKSNELLDLLKDAFDSAHNNDIGMSKADGSEVESKKLLDSLKDDFDKAMFIADCGSPSAFDEPVDCPNCTMCCESI